jgi:release factor glutamine methyltransferase
MTIREALRTAAERLELHRVSNARLTAEAVLAHLLSAPREYLHAHDDRVLEESEAEALENAIYDRVSGVPLQYIVGKQEFYGRYFHVNPSVLIPRPETEFIIEAVLGIRAPSRNPRQTPRSRILDVGTGSGCIGVTLALEIPEAEVFAADISEEAVRMARENARNLKAHVELACMDLMDAIDGPFDFIVSNPPYVSRGEVHRLQREVRDHEPHVALFGGLEIYERLIGGAARCLRPGGYLIMEIGFAMEEAIAKLFSEDWDQLPTKTDLQGIPRTIIARYTRDTSRSSAEDLPRN